MLHRSTAISCLTCILALATAAAAIEEASLPAVWQVKLDPDDVGLKERWNAADLDDSDWTALRTDDWEGWENQGLIAESDYGWYRVRYEIPEALEDRKYVYLYFNCVDEQAWIWLNGQEVGEHTFVSEGLVGSESERRDGMWAAPFALEIQEHLRGQGPDAFAVRVKRGGDAGGGVWQPVYLFASDTPLELGEMTSRAEVMNARALEAKEPTVQYEVWTTNPYDPIYPDTEGTGQVRIEQKGVGASHAHSLTDTIRASGTCGEYVPLAIHVRNHGDATLPVRFDLAGVRHEQTNLQLRTDRVQVHLVDYILTRRKKLVPDPLPRADGANGLRLGPGETGSLFVLVDTRGMPAGPWKGRVRFTPLRSGPKLEIPFELDVAPVVLPQRVPIWVTFWSYSPSHGWMSEGRGKNKPYMDLMRRAGTNVVQMSYRDGAPQPILDENDEIVGIRVDEFDRMMLRREFTHHDYLVVGLTIRRGTKRWGPHFLEAGHDQWKRNFAAYTRMLARHIRSNYGLADDRWGLYLNDEHIGDDFLPLGKLVRQADGRIQIWANRIEDLETTKRAEPYIDVIVPYSPWLSKEGLGFGRNGEAERFFLETGKPWWAYRHAFWTSPERTAIPRANPKSPHDMLRSRPWLAWKLGLDGYGFWVFTAPRWWGRYDGFPDVAPKGPYTNVGFIYMGHDGPITSRRLEAYRDGWEDYKLLWIVKQAAQIEGQDPRLARQALDEIDSAVERVLAGASQDELRLMRRRLMEHAVQLADAEPLSAMITGVETTRHSAVVRLSASQPARVWTWVNRGRNHRRFIDTSRQTHTPSVTIDNLVPGERCQLTFVVGGPHGQQRVLRHEVVTQGW